MSKIGRLWRTIKHLKTRQIIYQVWSRLRGRPRLLLPKHKPKAYFLTVPAADKTVSWQKSTFTFMNQHVSFLNQIDWNYAANGKLWTYNLTYFDFLSQPNVSPAEGLKLIHNFIAQTDSLRDGLEPYPTSLRLINWIQFLSRRQIQHDQINDHLFAQTILLRSRLEYHLAGNHLLENGFALLTSALYFRHERWFQVAARLVRTELTTQILADGGHDERSPMYHQILLDRLLTSILALQDDTWHTDSSLIVFLTRKATQMLGWLNAITFRNGDIPMLNDAAWEIAPTTAYLRQKAKRLLPPSHLAKKKPTDPEEAPRATLTEASGYRMYRQSRYELLADVGLVGPDHQPGHAHADTFSFVLYMDNQPIIVDSGTSTYEVGQRRSWERSTAAHNTVEVAKTNSSEVWAGFRVGRRANVRVMRNTDVALTARHTGYQHVGVIHQRSWLVEPSTITITDRLLNKNDERPSKQTGVARFHFQPNINVRIDKDIVIAGSIKLSFCSVTKLNIFVTNYDMAQGFNQLQSGQCLEIEFTSTLETILTLLDENTLPNLLL